MDCDYQHCEVSIHRNFYGRWQCNWKRELCLCGGGVWDNSACQRSRTWILQLLYKEAAVGVAGRPIRQNTEGMIAISIILC